jgi:hypothetical protein
MWKMDTILAHWWKKRRQRSRSLIYTHTLSFVHISIYHQPGMTMPDEQCREHTHTPEILSKTIAHPFPSIPSLYLPAPHKRTGSTPYPARPSSPIAIQTRLRCQSSSRQRQPPSRDRIMRVSAAKISSPYYLLSIHRRAQHLHECCSLKASEQGIRVFSPSPSPLSTLQFCNTTQYDTIPAKWHHCKHPHHVLPPNSPLLPRHD